MTQLTKLSVLVIIISSMTGCSWLWGDKGYFRSRSNDYLEARQAPLITVPANLQDNTRPLDQLYPIPNNVANTTSSRNYEVPRPAALQIVTDSKAASLQSNDGSQWFIVQQPPSQVYPQILQYFQQARFHIDTQQPHTGEFTTRWIKPTSLATILSGRLLASDSALNKQEIRVRVRIEPGVQANTSEIYTLVMAKPESSTATVDWPAKSENTAVESILLDELIANMSNAQTVDQGVSLVDDKNASAETAIYLTRDSQNIPVLSMAGNFDIVWSRIEQALTVSNIKIEDMDRSLGMYYINLSEKADGDSNPGLIKRLFSGTTTQADIDARAERYLVKVEPVEGMIYLSVLNVEADIPVDANKAETILKQIKDNFN